MGTIMRTIHVTHDNGHLLGGRTNQLTNVHVRAPHYHNPVAQTDRFKLAFDDTSKWWNGIPSIHVPIYGRGSSR